MAGKVSDADWYDGKLSDPEWLAQHSRTVTVGNLDDPEWRKERARKASAARHSIDARIDALVRLAPKLSAEQRERLALLLGGQT